MAPGGLRQDCQARQAVVSIRKEIDPEHAPRCRKYEPQPNKKKRSFLPAKLRIKERSPKHKKRA